MSGLALERPGRSLTLLLCRSFRTVEARGRVGSNFGPPQAFKLNSFDMERHLPGSWSQVFEESAGETILIARSLTTYDTE
jgi:hypothetical protein